MALVVDPGGEADEAGQRDDAEEGDRALDQRGDVGLAGRRRVGVLRVAVQVRPRLEDREPRREVGRQHREERLGHVEDLILERRVQHHLDAAAEREDRVAVRQRQVAEAVLVVPAGRRDAHRDLDPQQRRDARDRVLLGPGTGPDRVHDDEADDLALDRVEDRARRRHEELEPVRAEAEQEAAAHLEVDPALVVLVGDLQAAGDLERERVARQLVGAVLAADDEDLVAERVGRLLDEELAAVAVLDAPLLAGLDALDGRALRREPAEVLELELLAGVEGELERGVAGGDAVVVAVGRRRREQRRPGARQRDRGERVGRQAGEERRVAGGLGGEDDAARDPLERERLVVDRVRGVDLQQRLPAQVHAVGLQEVEVRREGGDAPEVEGREAAAGLEHERRRAGGDVPELDHLDRAGGLELEARDRAAARQRPVSDLEADLAADLEHGLVEQVGEPQLHPARDVDEEDLEGVRVGRGRLHLVDGVERLGSRGALVPRRVPPRAGGEGDASPGRGRTRR